MVLRLSEMFDQSCCRRDKTCLVHGAHALAIRGHTRSIWWFRCLEWRRSAWSVLLNSHVIIWRLMYNRRQREPHRWHPSCPAVVHLAIFHVLLLATPDAIPCGHIHV